MEIRFYGDKDLGQYSRVGSRLGLHAYRTSQHTDTKYRSVWFVAKTQNKLVRARELGGPGPSLATAWEFRGPWVEGAVFYGPWQYNVLI